MQNERLPRPQQPADNLTLWYEKPAKKWVEALPIGNGSLGAMVFGGTNREHIQFNEDTLWSGAPRSWDNPAAPHVLPQVRRALFAGDYAHADALCRQMQGPYNESYQPLGDLFLDFADAAFPVTEYRRALDIDSAIAFVRYRVGEAVFERDVFASFPDQVMVVHLTSDTPGTLTFTARLTSPHPHTTKADDDKKHQRLLLTGKAPRHVDPNYLKSDNPVVYDDGSIGGGDAMTFTTLMEIKAVGGQVSINAQGLHVAGADSVLLLLSAATSFNGFDKSPGKEGKDAFASAHKRLDAAAKHSYAELRAAHVKDHQSLFRRVSLQLGGGENGDTSATLPTDERVRRFHQTNEPSLAALLFQYGRYLLIASSRPGTQPANLQGIWNDALQPPWSSNYTLNINAQMNYWPVETANLAECHEPLLRYIADLAQNGTKTAATNYGCGGWVAHHNGDLWRQSAPVGNGSGGPVWANWPMGGAWLCQHLWEHYAFSENKAFLRDRAYPLMREAAHFCLDWMVEDTTGHLVTAPSFSPEIGFITPLGVRAETGVASTMDMAIIHDLFVNCIAASKVLDYKKAEDTAFVARLQSALTRLSPPKIGARGQLQEWADDFMEQDVHHRHVSHLFGVFPGRQITPEGTPDLMGAAKKSLELRGDAGTGWSLAWKLNLWARLRDGNHAHLLIRDLLTLVDTGDTNYHGGGGVYPNLFDAHPPFQIDGNFGFTSGTVEMLLQSHNGELHLLPALPDLWADGSVTGLRARGDFVVDLTWAAGLLTHAVIRAAHGKTVRVRYADKTSTIALAAGETMRLNGQLERMQII